MGVKEIIPSIEETKAQAIGFAANKAPSWAHGDYNFVGKWARALAQLFSGFFRALLQGRYVPVGYQGFVSLLEYLIDVAGTLNQCYRYFVFEPVGSQCRYI
jgi:hypothetical protein